MAEQQTWITVGGTSYGAQPDERGPIGGGDGYTETVSGGNLAATDLESLIDALSRAAADQVVFVPGDTEIDLTSFIYMDQFALELPEGVTLASDRGHGGSPGALLTSDALDTPTMLRILGPGTRVTGLRLRGPNTKRYIDHHDRAFSEGGGGHEYYYRFPTQSGITTEMDELEVDNCEISGFGLAGVHLKSGTGHRIHHCSIHHCQYQGLGYGVAHNTASSAVEHNLFDWNRHSIAGTGRPGCEYVARHNVELGTSLGHCFDMHGGRDRKDGTDVAGSSIDIHNNTFRAPEGPVVIRGVPEDRCDVHHNWFLRHRGPTEAVRASDRTAVFDNAYGEPARVIP
ncbi:right-handed parallel beta-helix repeat-containing protein [Candidatus Latescibacterota bacterium]